MRCIVVKEPLTVGSVGGNDGKIVFKVQCSVNRSNVPISDIGNPPPSYVKYSGVLQIIDIIHGTKDDGSPLTIDDLQHYMPRIYKFSFPVFSEVQEKSWKLKPHWVECLRVDSRSSLLGGDGGGDGMWTKTEFHDVSFSVNTFNTVKRITNQANLSATITAVNIRDVSFELTENAFLIPDILPQSMNVLTAEYF